MITQMLPKVLPRKGAYKMKTNVKRIAYYLKKLADYNSIHPSKRRNPYRQDRLIAYKKVMHKQIERECN